MLALKTSLEFDVGIAKSLAEGAARKSESDHSHKTYELANTIQSDCRPCIADNPPSIDSLPRDDEIKVQIHGLEPFVPTLVSRLQIILPSAQSGKHWHLSHLLGHLNDVFVDVGSRRAC